MPADARSTAPWSSGSAEWPRDRPTGNGGCRRDGSFGPYTPGGFRRSPAGQEWLLFRPRTPRKFDRLQIGFDALRSMSGYRTPSLAGSRNNLAHNVAALPRTNPKTMAF